MAESKCRISCITVFEVELIYGAYEEKKGEIGRFNGAPGGKVIGRVEGSGYFCKDDRCFANGRNRDAVVRSRERVLGSFVSAERDVLLQGDCV